MNRILLALVLLTAGAPAAASAIDGTWKVDVASAQLPAKPDTITLKDGLYACTSCTPPFSVRADGAFHPVAGHAYLDAVAVRVLDQNTIEESDRLKGKLVSTARSTVSEDGRTLTYRWRDMTAPSGEIATGEGVQTRVGKPPKGQHAVAGAWRTIRIAAVSAPALTATWQQQGNRILFRTADGFAYSAELGGKPVQVTGDPEGQTVAVREVPGGIEETHFDKGKVAVVTTLTVEPGGTAVKAVSQNRKRGTTTTYRMVKA